MSERTYADLLVDLDKLRGTQVALTDRLRRILTAMAMSEEVAAGLHQRLDALDDPPNGHRHSATVAVQAADNYRQFLSSLADRGDDL
jgi:hypothetical protein